MSFSFPQLELVLDECAAELDAAYSDCVARAPNYGVPKDDFRAAIANGVRKYLVDRAKGLAPSAEAVRNFISEIQGQDLYLAIACSRGNEHAWWEFDQVYRRFIEKIARHLASAEIDAEEVIDSVYVELYGTKVLDGVRQSKFATYSGRGTLRGWLRTVVWHAMIDLHRAKRDEVPLDQWTESGGEAQDRPGWRAQSRGGEAVLINKIARERYLAATSAALDDAFGQLDDHEKLILLYYHVEGLKLREIARLVEEKSSPLRRWFQRQSKRRTVAVSRVHESTIMRWLEKVYSKILHQFRVTLEKRQGLSPTEIEQCIEMAAEDLGTDVKRHLSDISEAVQQRQV